MDERGRCPGVSSSPQAGGDSSHVNGVTGGAGHNLDVIVHGYHQEDCVRLEQVPQLVCQRAQFLDIANGLDGRDHDDVAFDLVGFQVVGHPSIEVSLALAQRIFQKLAYHFQGSILLQQPGSGVYIARGGAGVE